MDIKTWQKADAAPAVEQDIAPAPAPAPQPSLDGRAAQFSHLIYADQTSVRERLEKLGATHVTNLNPRVKDWQNVVAVGFVFEGRAWIVFRGSDDLNDWAANLLFVPFRHLGFPIAWTVVKQDTLAFAQSVAPEVEGIVLTGHSLGGALATLATRDLAKTGHPIEALVTFGAPRVGSPLYAWNFNRHRANRDDTNLHDITRRYSTGREWVSRSPPFFLGFCHIGRDARFEHCEGRIAALSNQPLIAAIRQTSFDVVSLALPLFLPFLIVFGLDRAAYHDKAAYVRHFDHAKPLIDFGAPFPIGPRHERRRSHWAAVLYVLVWIIAAGIGLIYLVKFSFGAMALPVKDVLVLMGLVIFMQAMARWQSTDTSLVPGQRMQQLGLSSKPRSGGVPRR